MNLKHKQSHSPTYGIWHGMLMRCKDKNDKYYGGRGINVCVRWLEFENFFEDMGERPEGMSLDRIDNDGDYCPENCRWATALEQHRNKRSNKLLTWKGQTRCISEWAELLGLKPKTMYTRLHRGWSLSRVMTGPRWVVNV